jgi:hypothetical protein
VWWTIQAERSMKELRRVEAQVAQQKADLVALNAHYAALTSLTALDAWSKTHGPWKAATPNDIVTFEQ